MKTTHWHYYPQVGGHAKLRDGRLLFRLNFFVYDEALAALVLDWDTINELEELAFWQDIESDLKGRA